MRTLTKDIEKPNATYAESDAYLTLDDVNKIMNTIIRDNKVYTKGNIVFYAEVGTVSLAKVNDDKYILRFILPLNRENVYNNVCIGYSKLHTNGEVSLLGIRFDNVKGIEFSPKEWLEVKETIRLYQKKKDLIDLIS